MDVLTSLPCSSKWRLNVLPLKELQKVVIHLVGKGNVHRHWSIVSKTIDCYSDIVASLIFRHSLFALVSTSMAASFFYICDISRQLALPSDSNGIGSCMFDFTRLNHIWSTPFLKGWVCKYLKAVMDEKQISTKFGWWLPMSGLQQLWYHALIMTCSPQIAREHL